MTLLFALVLPALAAAPAAIDLARYPQQATVSLPAGPAHEVISVPLPLDLRSAADPDDGSDLAVLGGDGQPLAFTVARGPGERQSVSVYVRPTEERQVFELDGLDRPIDGLEIDLGGSDWVARAAIDQWQGNRWVPLAEPELIWEHWEGKDIRVDFPASSGLLRLRLSRLHGSWWRTPRVTGLTRAEPHVDPVALSLPVSQAVLLEDGWARYTVELPRPLPLHSVRLDVTDPVFERQVDVVLTGELDPYSTPQADGVVRRVRLGGAELDQVTLPVSDAPADLLVLYVASDGLVPLDLTGVTVMVAGEDLVIPAPGLGPLTVLAGADPNTTPTGDLDLALPELSRLVTHIAQVSDVQVNPAWLPPEVRAGLSLPGPELSLDGMTWAHPITADTAGLARIPLPTEVLADSRFDLGDLRIVDEAGQQIPYLLRRRPLDLDLGALPFTRTEKGARSTLRVPLPTAGSQGDGPPVATVRLTTGAPLFRRAVTLSRVRGSLLEPVRSFYWVGEDRPVTLSLDVDAQLGDELVITVENGDDPPLPIDEVRASIQHWELVAHVPVQGARLVYGDGDRYGPDYDLALVRGDLARRAATVATLGPRTELAPAPATALERVLVLVGLGALAGGLLVLIVGLVRAVPEPEADPETVVG